MSSEGIKFTWDPIKNAENVRKHHVPFDEAKTAFYDEHAKLIDDPDHSDDENRYIIMGMSATFRILLVCHCYRNDDNEIRIISARKAIGKEKLTYKGDKNA